MTASFPPHPKSLVFVSHSGQMSGAEKVMLDLIGLARDRGHRVSVACPRGPLTDRLGDDVAYVEIPALGLQGETGIRRVVAAARLVVNWIRAGAVVARRRRDAVFITNSLFALPAVALARPTGGTSWLVHDTLSSRKQKVVVRGTRSVIRSAVAVSEATARPLRDLGVPTVVAHNGVPWPVPELPHNLHHPPVVGILALLTPWKGHLVLLDAIAALPGVDVEFAGGSFPGDADHVAQLHQRAGEPDLAGRVRFLGHVPPLDALRRWDVVVSASVAPEAGPLSVLDAMSYGKPVVGTDHGGTTEFLSGGAGILVEPQQSAPMTAAISQIIDDETLRKTISREARTRIAASHDINRTLPRMLRELVGDQ